MKIRQWVDMGQEVEIEIGADDVRIALAEAFANVTQDRLGESGPNRAEIARALNNIAIFLKALTDEQIAMLSIDARKTVTQFLSQQADRFSEQTPETLPLAP